MFVVHGIIPQTENELSGFRILAVIIRFKMIQYFLKTNVISGPECLPESAFLMHFQLS